MPEATRKLPPHAELKPPRSLFDTLARAGVRTVGDPVAQKRIRDLEEQLTQEPELEWDVRFIAKVAIESILSRSPENASKTSVPMGYHRPHGIMDLTVWIGPGLRDEQDTITIAQSWNQYPRLSPA